MKSSIIFIVLAILSSVSLNVNAQDEITNDKLNIEKLFIEASGQKILGAFDEAERLYLEVLDRDKSNDAAAYELARIYTAQEKYQSALDLIEKAIKSSPDNEWYLVMRGDIYEKQREYAAAAGVYKELVELNPGTYYYYEHLIELYKKTEDWKNALSTLERYEKKAGVLVPLIKDKYEILDRLGRIDEATEELEKLVMTYPERIEFYHLVAAYCKQTGRADKARQYYQSILKLDPNDSKANLALAKTYKDQGQDVAYLGSVKDVMANPDIDIDVKIQELIPFVERLTTTFDTELANTLEDIVTVLDEVHPNEAKVHALKGDVLYATGNLDAARRAYEKTIVLNDGVLSVWEQLIRIQSEQQDMAAVIRTAENAMDVFPNQASLYFMSGLAYAQIGKYFDAGNMLEQALIMSAGKQDLKFEILSLLGSVYQQTGQTLKSFDAFEKALAINSDFPATLNSYSFFLIKNGEDLDKARKLANKAVSMQPQNPAFVYTLALAYYTQGDFKTSRSTLDNILQGGGSNAPEILELYGDVLFSLNDVDKAVDYWQSSLDNGNPSELLPRKISERKILH